MKTLVKVLLFAVCMATGCSTVGCCGGVAGADSNLIKDEDCAAEADTAAVQGSASGTFTDSANNVSATITNAIVSVSAQAGSGTATSTTITIEAQNATFSTPAGATSEGLEISIEIPATPSNSTFTATSSGVTGSATIGYSTSNGGDSYSAATASGAPTGSWTLAVTSNSQICSISTTTAAAGFYKIHGTFTATMPDDNTPAGSGSLSLTF